MEPARAARWMRLGILFLAIVGFLAATYSYRRITDTELNSYQTRALVRHGDVDLDRYPRVARPGFFTVRRGDLLLSIYGVGVSVAAAPVYAVLTRTRLPESVLEGAVAIPYVAGAVVLMYVLLARLAEPRLAVAGTMAFGFGTTMWPLASMAFFQHGPVALFQVLGLTGLFSDRRRAPALAGLGFGAAAFIRPTTAIAFALVGLHYLSRGRRPLAGYAAGALVPLAGLVVQNRWLWGSWLTGGYSHSGIGFNADVSEALRGLLFGWWRGIFVYSPVLAIGVVGFVMALRRARDPVERRLVVLGASCVATVAFYSTWTTWWNGLNQFGYRYLLDIVPFLVVLGVYAASRSERVRTIALPLAALSILTMTFGAEPNRFGWDGVMFPDRMADSSLGQAWIAFANRPAGAVLRLAGLAAIAALFLRLAPRPAGPPAFRSSAA